MKNKIANLVLLASGLIFLGTYPFKDNIGVALLMHVSGAAFIGGIADWYGVTALFDKPFGISFKTEIIPRSRQRFIELAGDMVRNELLTSANVYNGIKHEQPLQQILKFLLSANGRIWVEDSIKDCVNPLVKNVDFNAIINEILESEQTDFRVSPYINSLGDYILKEDNAQIVWKAIQSLLFKFASSEILTEQLVALVAGTKKEYLDKTASQSGLGSLISLIAGAMGPETINKFINEEKIGKSLQKELIKYIEAQESLNSSLGQKFYAKLKEYKERLAADEKIQELIESKKILLVNKALEKLDDDLPTDWSDKLKDKVYAYLENLNKDKKAQRLPERQLLRQVASLAPKMRDMAAQIAMQELESYSEEDFKVKLKNQVAMDLQMIRINGSLVGGLLGGVFFALALIVKGVLG